MQKLFKYPSGLQIYLLITLPAYLLTEIMARVIVVRPRIQLSQVSAIAAMQIWYWLVIFILIPLFIFLRLKLNFSKEKIITLILYAGISLNIAFIATANNLALSKVPLPPGDIRGDNGGVLEMMIKAERTGWSGVSYPPVWPSFVGNVANITGSSVLEVWKPLYLASILFMPGIVLLVWNISFKPLFAAAFTFLFTFSNLGGTGSANYIFFGSLIAIVTSLFVEKNLNFQFNFKFFILGLLLGISSLTYFGHLWWTLLALLFLIIIYFLFIKNYEFILKIFDASLGFSLVFAPTQVGSRLNISSEIILILIIILLVVRILLYNIQNLMKALSILTLPLLSVGIIFALLTNRIGDSWFYPELEQNPVPNVGLTFNFIGVITITLIIIGLILAIKEFAFKATIIVSISTFLSAVLMMLWFASRMEITGMVELYPRASGTYNFAWYLLTLVALLAIISSKSFEVFIKRIWPQNLVASQNIFLILIISFPLAAVHSRALSEVQYGIFPRAENGIWLAYRACDNPHEDPMLAKVFEEKPFIQDFLRENCPKVDWPVIPPINPAE